MKTLLKILFVAAFGVAGIFALSARKSASTRPLVKQSVTYYYYPKVNVYYDVAHSIYIYLAEDGKTWESAKQVSDKLTTGMGKKAVLINPPLPVWKSNDHHKMVYSTALYAAPTDFRKDPPKPPPVNKSAEIKKVEAQKTEKKESGVERFFKRLFKKKSADDKKSTEDKKA
jgi:hypothetical protein